MTGELKSIKRHWEEYAAMCIPKDASQVQREETEQAFYAGAWAMVANAERMGEPDISDEQGLAWFEARMQESLQFKDRLMAKYAEKN